MMDAGRHPRIQLLVNTEVEDVTGTLEDHRFAALYGREGKLVGVLGFNRPRHVMQYKTMIENGTSFADAIAAEV